MNPQLNYEAVRSARIESRYARSEPPQRPQRPPGRRLRGVTALRLARLARRLDDGAAWRAFAP